MICFVLHAIICTAAWRLETKIASLVTHLHFVGVEFEYICIPDQEVLLTYRNSWSSVFVQCVYSPQLQQTRRSFLKLNVFIHAEFHVSRFYINCCTRIIKHQRQQRLVGMYIFVKIAGFLKSTLHWPWRSDGEATILQSMLDPPIRSILMCLTTAVSRGSYS